MQKTYITIAILVVLIIGAVALIIVEKKGNDQKDLPKDVITEEENKIEEVNMAESELKIEVIKEGSGEVVTKHGDMISVHYTGTLEDGTKFDSSLDRGDPFKFDLGAGQVIRGWDQGLLDMKVGEKRKLIIPPSLGYGDMAIGDKIPANSILIFEVELIEIL